jgi:hypothetical protein
MIWVAGILIFICLLLLWLLLAPLQLEIDSRKPGAALKWVSIGNAAIWYEDEWWLSFRVLFFQKKIRVASMKAGPKKAAARPLKKPKRRPKGLFKKIVRVLRTFRVKEYRLAVDTGDYVLNAQLYPLNFQAGLRNHLLVNFTDENYLYIRIRNRPVKMLYAFLC